MAAAPSQQVERVLRHHVLDLVVNRFSVNSLHASYSCSLGGAVNDRRADRSGAVRPWRSRRADRVGGECQVLPRVQLQLERRRDGDARQADVPHYVRHGQEPAPDGRWLGAAEGHPRSDGDRRPPHHVDRRRLALLLLADPGARRTRVLLPQCQAPLVERG